MLRTSRITIFTTCLCMSITTEKVKHPFVLSFYVPVPSRVQHMLLYEHSNSEMDIIRDIDRTYPSHVYFKQKHGPGQRALFNVLKAYSVYDKKIGYVQVCN